MKNNKNPAESIEDFKQNLIKNMPGLIAFSITDLETGMALVSHSNDKDFDVELAASYNLEVVRAKLKAIKALNLNEKIKDILITLESHIHIIDIAVNGEYFIYVAVNASQGNLGITRSLLKTYKADLMK